MTNKDKPETETDDFHDENGSVNKNEHCAKKSLDLTVSYYES